MALDRLAKTAKQKLAKLRNQRSRCCGPAAVVVVATCKRLGWGILDAANITTDVGRETAVEIEVKEAVRGWRWRRVEKGLEMLTTCMETIIWSLLKPKANNAE